MDIKGDIAVVGAGPAGLLTSLYISSYDVLIIEEHNEVGKPKHCAGFVGVSTAKRYVSILGWDIIDYKYDTITFYTPRGKYTLYFNKPVVYHINRPLLEEKLLDKVLSKGHKIVFNKKAKPGNSVDKIIINGYEHVFQKIVAADGPYSVFRKKYFREHREKLIGIQYVFRTSNVEPTTIHTLFNNYTPEFFQWLAPLDHDKALIGFATRKYHVHPDKIVAYISRKTGIKLGSKIEVFGGVIPYDKPLDNPIYMNKVFFIGDSVPFIKPYTGGGLLTISVTAPALGLSLERSDTTIYIRLYKLIRSRIIYEYLATNLARRLGYWIPPYIVYYLYRFKMLDLIDYDNHYQLLIKSLPLSLYILYKLLKP